MTGELFVEAKGQVLNDVTGGVGINSGVPAITAGIIQRKHSGLEVVEQAHAESGVITLATGNRSRRQRERRVVAVNEVPVPEVIEEFSPTGGGLGGTSSSLRLRMEALALEDCAWSGVCEDANGAHTNKSAQKHVFIDSETQTLKFWRTSGMAVKLRGRRSTRGGLWGACALSPLAGHVTMGTFLAARPSKVDREPPNDVRS